MSLHLKFQTRTFGEPLTTPDVVFVVNSFSHNAIGGPEKCNISISGTEEALWQCVELLRCPVEVYDEKGVCKWWGMVQTVLVRKGSIEVGVSVADMANRVAVVYSQVVEGSATAGKRATTTWADDVNSEGEYGTKEKHVTLNNATTTTANQVRDIMLANLKNPLGQARPSGANAEGSYSATLECVGWWPTLDWKFFSASAFQETWNDAPPNDTQQTAGDTQPAIKAAQTFQFPSAGDSWAVQTVQIRLHNNATPGPSQMEIQSTTAGAPNGVVLATSNVVLQADVLDGYTISNYTTYTFPTPPMLSGANVYALVLRRQDSSTVAGTSWDFMVNAGNPYARGSAMVWDNALGWVTGFGGANSDWAFRINGVLETTEQVKRIVTAAGQFLVGTEIINASGVYSSPYRNGDSTAKSEIEALLKNGTTGLKRLLATVTQDRIVRIYEEPTATSPVYALATDGSMFDQYDNLIEPNSCPVAGWCLLKDLVPATADLTNIASPSPFFIEQGTFDTSSGSGYTPTPRGVQSQWAIGGLKT